MIEKMSLSIILSLRWVAAEFLKQGQIVEFKINKSLKSLQASEVIPVGY